MKKDKLKIITTEEIDKIVNKFLKGNSLERSKRIFYRGEYLTLDGGVMLALTKEELNEYSKCFNDIYYFIEKYLNIKLREYQRVWIDEFLKNRFTIYCVSRQTGYSRIMSCVYLHYMIFNLNKNILVNFNKGGTCHEFMSMFFDNYLKLPYFIKPGIITKNKNNLTFNNGNKIYAICFNKHNNIFDTIDILSYFEFSHMPANNNYKDFIPMLSIDGRCNISSQPNGNNKFYELLENSERKNGDPLKNNYKSIRTYWWEVEGRDEIWKQNVIKEIGLQSFNQEYDLSFRNTI